VRWPSGQWSRGPKKQIPITEGAPGSIVTPEQNGLLVKYHDPVELAHALKTLLASPERRRQMGYAEQKKVLTEFMWDIVADRFRAVYVTVCEKHNDAGTQPAHFE
jgi:glycosyltransferase involved in cell wall biosynthesis